LIRKEAAPPFALSLSKPVLSHVEGGDSKRLRSARRSWFDKLTTNGFMYGF